ncbi:uncharacterized protein HMPREF1541_08354 [Cyphellophora europaea CBS 101466]|uniref:Flavin reductase like domain-containing protein n=1 Tax=Cyphellophora europaea (strain CBS 101466) TaxID=1220924 RepID=W2RNW5_CYPE1|nr:uncharacterized protein HMPREF1541_08354 [Cyphellophora europaea CBS 101466]ETN37363.1 hypothetical protein HMPREF1541_08354 [Cyphellophora europaea CBS 101466]
MNLTAATPLRLVSNQLARRCFSSLAHRRSTRSKGAISSYACSNRSPQSSTARNNVPRFRSRSTAARAPDLADSVRKLMRHVPHPVAIVTAAPKATSQATAKPSRWRGATISSFVTVALDPEPVVCFNIKHDSSTFATLTSSATFNVHLLSSSPDAETIATKFASGNALEPFHDGEGELEWWVREPSSDEGVAPVIHGMRDEVEAEGTAQDSVVTFRLTCAYMADKTVAVGDHVVVFGRVIAVSDGSDLGHPEASTRAACLLYVDGGYGRTAGR